jgi:hypothetical protein
MGEAKRKRDSRAAEPCKCGSGKAAGECCFDGRTYTKQPALITLSNPNGELSVEGCYLSHTRGCGGPITREHLISESVLKLLNQGELLTLAGAAWQQPSESTKIGLSALTAKCLCEHHNSTSLSPLDAAAKAFFAAVQSAALNNSGPPISILVSGHDIERWMLKTLFALAHGKILARNGQVLPKRFHEGIDEAQLLTNPNAWPERAGLYSTHFVGQLVNARNYLDVASITVQANDALIGLRFTILGLTFDFMADLPPNSSIGTNVLYRPGRLTFRQGSLVNEVIISWIDGVKDHGTVAFDTEKPKAWG